jgi:hypothetical protein
MAKIKMSVLDKLDSDPTFFEDYWLHQMFPNQCPDPLNTQPTSGLNIKMPSQSCTITQQLPRLLISLKKIRKKLNQKPSRLRKIRIKLNQK